MKRQRTIVRCKRCGARLRRKMFCGCDVVGTVLVKSHTLTVVRYTCENKRG